MDPKPKVGYDERICADSLFKAEIKNCLPTSKKIDLMG